MRIKERAVVDRIEDGRHAVLIVGDEQRQVVVPAAMLPAGASEGKWLLVELDGDELVSAMVDGVETERARGRIAYKMRSLRERDSDPRRPGR